MTDDLTAAEPGPEDEDEIPTAALEEADLFRRIKGWHKNAQGGFDRWREAAEKAFDFVAGHQWTDDEIAKMEAAGRPLLTFDRLGPVIDVVVGSEINNRQEVSAKPRDNTDVAVAEVAGDIIEFIRDDADADDAEGDAFRDNLVAGMGWVEIRVSESGSRNLMHYDRVDPFEMRWPNGVTAKNLRHCPWLLRIRSIDRLAAEEMLPGHSWSAINATWAKAHDSEGEPHSVDPSNRYRDDANPDDDAPDRVTVVEAQWLAREPIYRTKDPETGQDIEIDEAMALQLQSQPVTLPTGQQIMWPVSQTMQRVAYRAFVGAQAVLDKVRLPTQQLGMTYVCQTGKWDRKKRLWYGIVRGAMDPQRFANKSISMYVEIMAAGAKGGLMAEVDAFEDEEAAKKDWANPSALVWMAQGGLNKVKERPAAQYPQNWHSMFQLSLDAIPAATGVNPELMGLRDVQQAGILEHQRKQAAVTILAGYFDSLRRARKQAAEIVFALATSPMFEDQDLARIVGPEKAGAIPMLRRAGVEQFDIVIDESPQSANAKERTWAALSPLMPLLVQMGVPAEVWSEILRVSPLPSSFVEKVIQQMGEQKPDQAAEAMKQLAAEKMKVDIEAKSADAAKSAADARKKDAETATERLDAMIKAGEVRQAAGDRMEARALLNGG